MNPFIISKLDLNSIRMFHYPVGVRKEQNPYVLRQSDDHWELMQGKTVNIALAQQRFNQPKAFQKHVIDVYQDQEKDQGNSSSKPKIKTPPMLELQCNAVELVRLRQELMMCLSECAEL